jgi:N-acetylmuramoyl-L-alanine amidase
MGEIINNKVAAATALSKNSPIESPYLILFNKSPVPIAYMEIGFFDDDSDLSILKSSSDKIGKAIAEGVDEYLKNN